MHAVTAGSILSRSFKAYLQNFVPFTIISALVHIPTLVVMMAISRGEVEPDTVQVYNRFSGIIETMLANIASGAMTYGVFMQLRGDHVGVGKSLLVGLQRLLPVLGVGLLVALAVGVGMLALLVPGIILSCMLYVAVPAAVVEKPGLFGALGRSRELTQGYKLTIFGMSFLMGVIMIVITVILGIVLVKADQGPEGLRTFFFALWVFSIVIGSWQAVAAAVTYHDLRVVKEGVVSDELAKVFD